MAKLSAGAVRRIAISLPETVELDHHGVPSFRVGGKIFATLWDPAHVNIMISPVRIVVAVEENPKVCTEVWWGRQLRCVQVDLTAVSEQLVRSLLSEAWKYKKKTPRVMKKRNNATTKPRCESD